MKTVIIIQARMGSTRLPGKVLKEVAGRPLLEYVVRRAELAEKVQEVIVATTDLPLDDAIADFCKSRSISYFRGSENDVLSRYHGAAEQAQADAVVRITSDCPLIDPVVISNVVTRFQESDGRLDYVSNTIQRTFPRGMDTEIFSRAALEIMAKEAVLQRDREHVTQFIIHHPERFQIEQVIYPVDYSRHRWTVDTIEDFDLVSRLISAHDPSNITFSLEDLLNILEAHPEWALINQHIEQKKL